MLKKIAVVTLGVMAASAALSFTKVGSYGGTAWGKFRTCASQQVPVEFEIDRLKHEVAQLIPDMKKNRSVIAEEMVAVENLREEIATTRVNLDKQKTVLLKLSRDLEGGETTFVIEGRSYKKDRVAEKLSRDLETFKRVEGNLKTREQLLEAKERALDSAKEQLSTMRDQKHDLEVQIAQLEAEVKNVRLAQTKSKFAVDDSRLAEIKRSLSELRGRLKAERIETELEGQFTGDVIPSEKVARPVGELAREAREYLEGDKVADKK